MGLFPESGRAPREGMETHSSILAWESPWTEEPSGLLSMGLQRVGHDIVTKQQQQELARVTLCQELKFSRDEE